MADHAELVARYKIAPQNVAGYMCPGWSERCACRAVALESGASPPRPPTCTTVGTTSDEGGIGAEVAGVDDGNSSGANYKLRCALIDIYDRWCTDDTVKNAISQHREPPVVKVGSGTREERYLNAYDQPILLDGTALLERARTAFEEKMYQAMAETRREVRRKAAARDLARADGAGPGPVTPRRRER